MLPDGRRLGAHLPIADGMVKAADRAAEIGATALQVFSDNPTAWQRRAEPSPEIAAFREALDAHDIAPLVVHASYLINLAGADDVLRDRSIELLASELDGGRALRRPDRERPRRVAWRERRRDGDRAPGRRDRPGVRRRRARATTRLRPAAGAGLPPIVAVESSSGGGWGIGVSVAEWSAIARAADAVPAIRDRVAFCLDTAHLWGAGIDVSRPAAIDDLLAAFDGEVGLDRLALVHLNDTRAGLGSRMDRHEHLGAGEIGADGLGHLLRHPRLGDVPYHPRDAGHGGGLRRDQPGAGQSARQRRRPRAIAAGGVRSGASTIANPRVQGAGRGGWSRRRGDGRTNVSDAAVESSPEQPLALELGAVVGGPDAGAEAAIETNSVAAAAQPGILEGLGIAGRLGVSERAAFWLGIAGIVAVAALLRVVNLSTRGTWDADQGHDMLVLRDLVQRGQVPLLGPPTSIGDFHHGVLYYFLLAPAAAISGADPLGVTLAIALAGIAAVAVTAWLGRAIGGTAAGLVAGLLMAVSASAVDESTFIWNPNLIALSSSIALAAAWHAWQARRPRWWIVAGAAAVVTMHLHVLGIVLTPVIAGLLVADLVRRRQLGDPDGTPEVVSAIGWWIVLAVASYVPLAIHEAQSGASELRAAAAFLLGGGEPAATSLPARLPIVGLRVLGWPLTGLITAAPIATLLSSTLVVVLAVWRGWLVRPRTDAAVDERTGIRWLGLGLAWTIAGLAVGASSLATVVLGLPNDHYHAFADPMVFVVARGGGRGPPPDGPIRGEDGSGGRPSAGGRDLRGGARPRARRLEPAPPAAGRRGRRRLAGGPDRRGADLRRDGRQAGHAREPARGEVRRCRPVPPRAGRAGDRCRRGAVVGTGRGRPG